MWILQENRQYKIQTDQRRKIHLPNNKKAEKDRNIYNEFPKEEMEQGTETMSRVEMRKRKIDEQKVD